ncbi:ABC transporter permease [Rhodococcus sp. ARC_M13]|uniref:ABC transporter permease n=1 Tax=Rhodococcus TaxID=1827 RepID=UPI0018A30543|nr:MULTISPECIES: ABC transporter permease [Rhodococcus]MBF7732648.1 ABC transporter permease [Rhodococcus erythropolis]MCJ0900884.1 ABC transporter permease [Rhodococcus sp. ARC_M13]MCZ4641305.1 ABC transporter permease [Rhodococcus erythropolis]
MTTLVRAETLKVLTLRYWWALAIAPVVVAVLIAASTRTFVEVVADSADTTFDVDVVSTGVSLGVSNTLVLVFAAVFGALTAGSEFGYKTLTTTFLTARGRDGVLGAKLAVVAVFAVGYALAVEVVSIGAMLLFGRDFSFTTDLFAICAAGILVCALWALLGAGVALLTGSSMAGALSVILWFVFGEWIVRAVLLAMDLGGIGAVLPVSATIGTIVNAAPSIDVDAFASWPSGPMMLAAWVVLFCGLGWLRTRTRDIT